jgi:hypothetical protein
MNLRATFGFYAEVLSHVFHCPTTIMLISKVCGDTLDAIESI